MRQATVQKRREEDLEGEETVDGSMLSAELMGAVPAPSYTYAVAPGGPHTMVFSSAVHGSTVETCMCAGAANRVSIGHYRVPAMPRET
jgi:hypothetical protein